MTALRNKTEFVILFLLMFIPSLRAIYKYLPKPEVASFFWGISLLLFYYLLFNKKIVHFHFKKRSVTFLLAFAFIFVFSILSYLIYPIADARKTIGKGSSADDAIIEPVKNFLSNGKLYDVKLYDGAPVSPGPAWILINSIFVFYNCYFLITPVYLVVHIMVYWYLLNRKSPPYVPLALLSSSIIFWELMVTGHDLIALGCSLAIIVMLVYRYCLKSNKTNFSLSTILLSILIGAISTSRIVFICLPFLIGFLTMKFKPLQSLYIMFISLTTAILFHLFFYMESDFYQPLHLFEKAQSNISTSIILSGVSSTIILAIIAIFRVQNNFRSLLKWFFILLAIPLSHISFGAFLSTNKDLASWEGANYIVPTIPVFLLYISDKYTSLSASIKTQQGHLL